MKDGSDTMSTKGFDCGESPFGDIIFDNGTNVFVIVSGLDKVECLEPTIVGGL